VPVFLGGAAVRAKYAVAQRSARWSTSLLTYVDTCELGIDVDTGAIPDYALFHDVIVPGFDEVLSLPSGVSVAASARRASLRPGRWGLVDDSDLSGR